MGQGKLQVQGRSEDMEFYFPAALEKAGMVPAMPCSAPGTLLTHLFLTEESPLSLPGLGHC